MSFNTLIAVRVSLHLVKAVLELHCGEFRWWTPWLRTKAGRATSSVRSGALPLTLIQYRYISISLQLYIHTSIVHLGMQGFLPRLCAQRYAADKSVLDRINATLLLCALGSLSQTANDHLKLPADSSLGRQMQLVLSYWKENGAATQVKGEIEACILMHGLRQSVHRSQSANPACCGNKSSRCTVMHADLRAKR